jgi:hypothetical protein
MRIPLCRRFFLGGVFACYCSWLRPKMEMSQLMISYVLFVPHFGITCFLCQNLALINLKAPGLYKTLNSPCGVCPCAVFAMFYCQTCIIIIVGDISAETVYNLELGRTKRGLSVSRLASFSCKVKHSQINLCRYKMCEKKYFHFYIIISSI